MKQLYTLQEIDLELDAIKGARSDRIEALLGYAYGEEAVHRNNLVIL